MKERLPGLEPVDERRPGQVATIVWFAAGIAGPLLFFVLATPSEASLTPILGLYLLVVMGLDFFVGASGATVSLQRITPAVVLTMLVTPGVPPALALGVDLLGAISVASMSRTTRRVVAQFGKALIPASLTAFYVITRGEVTPQTYFFACEIFVLAYLVTRTERPPFRSDVVLVVCYPAVALLLRYLAGLGLIYLLMALPLLFLLTTADTQTLLRCFQLTKRLADSQTQIRQTRRVQRKMELESRRKGILLLRKEQQLSLLNGLGREMEAAEAAEDLGRFLLAESVHLTGAQTALVLLCDGASGRVLKVISPSPQSSWGIKEGEPLPEPVTPGISPHPPWHGPLWHAGRCFLCCSLGRQGWLFLAREEDDAFPGFLEEFFAAVGRHAGSAVLALRRLTEVKATALREARERQNVAAEKEKVAEQNRSLRILLEGFEGLAEGSLACDQELLSRASDVLKRMTGADEVVCRAREFEEYPAAGPGLRVDDVAWPSYLFCTGNGASGNLLCLSQRPRAFLESQLEWCSLLQRFLDKTLENNTLHRELQASYTQLKRTQQEVIVSSQWAAAGRLAANAAHELNTPLGAIRIAAEHITLYLHHGGDATPAVESMESLMRSVDRCQRVTDRLLITSRPADRGTGSEKATVHGLSSILADAVASVKPYLRASRVKLVSPELAHDPQVMVVIGDLYWALVNLLKNGIDALNEENSADKQIVIALEQAQDSVRITVGDNGPGVADEVKPRLFEPFFTTKKLGLGNGLGLSLSRTNLQRWGGEIRFEDTPGRGATFVLKVPLAKN